MKSRRPPRWLPEHVTEYRDRHGKARYRFRRKGYPTHQFRSTEPGSDAFLAELAACRRAQPVAVGIDRAVPGSFDDLIARYYQSPRWLGMASNSQATYRGIIERFRDRRTNDGTRYGEVRVAAVTIRGLDRILGAMASTPAAANNLRKVLKRLLAYGVKIGFRSDNPADATDSFKGGKGFHTWTDDEIEQFRARHGYGTKARLAMELALNTAARRCNVASLERSMLRRGKFHVAHVKGCDETIVAASVETLAAIEAMPVVGIGHFLVTEYGKPFTPAGFGGWFRDRCNEADLPHCSLHGLRKAQSRRLAESGATSLQGRAVTGHRKDETFAYYAEKADRERMADDAMANLANAKMANREKLT